MAGKPTCEELEQRVKELEKEVEKRKLAEEALDKYRSLSEQSADAIYISARESEFVYFNQSFLNLFGYTKEEMEYLKTQDIYANIEDRSGFLQEIEKTGSIRDFGIKLCKKDGTEIDCLITANIRRADDGSILEYQGIIRDISEKKKLEVQFQQAQKMEAIGTLAGGIAHDFNNLLMGIQGHASLMLMDVDSTHPHYKRLTGIEEQIQSGAELTKHLLGFARGGKYEVNPTDLNEIIKKTSSMFGRTKKEIKIHRKYQKDIYTVDVDRGQIEQVLLNLYVNAWQAMPGGGELYLQTEKVTLDENYIKPFQVEPGKYVKISVTDTGVGMDKATQQRIFEPFFTTKEMGRGSGLGLASAYGIIKNPRG
jgi:PAS domain S-box-containing protein